jgi:leader peptidase (prepilin peptidase)/N-methyltransferase
MSCGETLRWYELFPVVSYLVLRARCKSCSAYIPYRYLLVELLTGGAFLLMYTFFGHDLVLLILYAVLSALLVLIVVYDLRHTIIPDELSIGVGIISLLELGYRWYLGEGFLSLFSNLLAGIGVAGFFYGLWYVSKGRWIGLGDAKLALPLGVIAGTTSAISMLVLSFWIGAAVSLLLLGLQKIIEKGKTMLSFPLGHLTMKSEVPFAPFLVAGFLLAHLFHADIFVITSFLIPL